MKSFQHLLIDRVGTDDRVGRINLNRPEKLNALSVALLRELSDALHVMESDDSVRVIILRGLGRAFSVGYDLASITAESLAPGAPAWTTVDESGRPLSANMQAMLRQTTDLQMYFWNMAKVTISECHGFCVAGGCEFAMMSDLVTGSEDCVFGHPGHRGIGVARNGLIWPLVIPMRKAKELLYTGDAVTGREAAELGMINYSWPVGELEKRTIELADRVANTTADYLAGIKAVANRFYENMGIHSSVRSATEMDITLQSSRSAYEFTHALETDGIKAAVTARDRPYGDYGATPPNE